MYSNYLSTLNGSLNLHAKHLPYRPWRCQYAPLPPCAKPPKAGLSEARHRFYAHTRQGASHRASSPGNSGLAPDFLRMALLVSRWKSKPASLPTLPMSYRCSLQWGRQAPSGNNVVVLAAPHSLHFQWGGGTGASWQKRVGRLALRGILPPDSRDLDAPRTGGATWLQFAATGKKKETTGEGSHFALLPFPPTRWMYHAGGGTEPSTTFAPPWPSRCCSLFLLPLLPDIFSALDGLGLASCCC